MNELENKSTIIICPKCETENTVTLIQIMHHDVATCSKCKTDIDLSAFDPDAEKTKRINQKQLDKLKKLLGN